jgi:hypothetical protein
MGCDIGQSQDPSAVCVIEYCDGVTDYGSEMERNCNLTQGLGLQKKAERWRCLHMETLALGTRYGAVVQHVASLLAAPQLKRNPDKNQSAAELVIDAGGVGRGVAEMFTDAGLDPICVTLTGGMETTHTGRNRFNVSKHEIVTLLDARLNHDRFPLTFSKHLAEAEAFKAEVADFTRSIGGAGRAKFEARQGKADDRVISVALVVWWKTSRHRSCLMCRRETSSPALT